MPKKRFSQGQLIEMLYDDSDDLRLLIEEAGEPHGHIQSNRVVFVDGNTRFWEAHYSMNVDGAEDGSPGPFVEDGDDDGNIACNEVQPEAVTAVIFTAMS